MSTTVAVDPGLRGCGVAVFYYAELREACYVRSTERQATGPVAYRAMAQAVAAYLTGLLGGAPTALVLELQHIYQVQRRGKAVGADPNDLLGVASVVGALTTAIDAPRLIGVEPGEWKGQTDKVICQLRVNKRLSLQEAARIVMPPSRTGRPSELAHNVYDAIGIGLWAVGRWKGEQDAEVFHGRGAPAGGAGGAAA